MTSPPPTASRLIQPFLHSFYNSGNVSCIIYDVDSPTASLFKSDFSYSCAGATDKISTDSVSRGPLAIAELLFNN